MHKTKFVCRSNTDGLMVEPMDYQPGEPGLNPSFRGSIIVLIFLEILFFLK